MPSPLRDPKTLPDWLELDYFQRPRGLWRLRRLLTWGAFLACCPLVLAWSFWPRKQVIYQAGPVAYAHAFFNEDCRACHQDNFQTARHLWGSADAHSVSDSACQQCHSGGPHHDELANDAPRCAECHREHRGGESLARVPDRHCTHCHATLPSHDKQPPRVQNVADFATHPEFALWGLGKDKDPTNLHFNHQVHLNSDGVRIPAGVSRAGEGHKEKLDCASCHKPDAERRFLRPVNYEQHCARCHALSLQPPEKADQGVDNETRAVLEQFRKSPAPHQAPAQVRAALRDRLMHLLEEHPKVLELHASPPSVRLPPAPLPEDGQPVDRLAWVEQQLRQEERTLFDGAGACRYCHLAKNEKDATPAAFTPGRLPEFMTTGIPAPLLPNAKPNPDAHRRWLPNGQFNHDSHRLLQCTECHAATQSHETSDLLMPHIDTCKKCHNDTVGVRSRCIDCHRYHDRAGDAGWQGSRTISDALGR